jgi:hypothetical protein
MIQWCCGRLEGSFMNIRKFVEWPVVASTPARHRVDVTHARGK